MTPEEDRLSEFLTLVIEDFESKHYQLSHATPVEVLCELMRAHDLKQSHLTDVLGTKSVTSEVFSGKRDLSKTHIQKLSERFHVSTELLFRFQ